MNRAKAKGSAGEIELCRWIEKTFELEKKSLQRNLEQTRDGGSDIMGFPPFQFEVKRCEVTAKRDWWLQVSSALRPSRQPVVAFRRNRQPWRFLISARNIGLENGYMELEEREFTLWAKNVLFRSSLIGYE